VRGAGPKQPRAFCPQTEPWVTEAGKRRRDADYTESGASVRNGDKTTAAALPAAIAFMNEYDEAGKKRRCKTK